MKEMEKVKKNIPIFNTGIVVPKGTSYQDILKAIINNWDVPVLEDRWYVSKKKKLLVKVGKKKKFVTLLSYYPSTYYDDMYYPPEFCFSRGM